MHYPFSFFPGGGGGGSSGWSGGGSSGGGFGGFSGGGGSFGGGGASQVLPRLVGMGRAMHLLLSGQSIGADGAFQMGLVEEVVDSICEAVRAA